MFRPWTVPRNFWYFSVGYGIFRETAAEKVPESVNATRAMWEINAGIVTPTILKLQGRKLP